MKITNLNSNLYLKNSYKNFKVPQIPRIKNEATIANENKKINLKPLYYALGIAGAFAGGMIAHKLLFKGISKTSSIPRNPIIQNSNTISYKQSLLEGIEKTFGIKLNIEALSCIPDKKEFREIVTSLKEENYVLSPKNMLQGIYRADLHSPLDILEQARKYSDELFQKTGKKFAFALSDHDSVDGVVEILGQIAKEPQKYSNLKFIPAIELSFAHIADKSANKTETSELLAYCINPFDEKLKTYLQNLHAKRRNMIEDTIKEFQKRFPHMSFSKEEFSKIYGVDLQKDMFGANLHWKVAHYGQTKYAISNLANQKGKNSNTYYEQIMQKTDRNKALGNLKDLGLIPQHIQENEEISRIRATLQPLIQTNKTIQAAGESTSGEIFSAFENQDCTFAFAHPYYFKERLHTPFYIFKSIIAESKEKLTMSEGYHQAYAKTIDKSKINEQNQMFESLGLVLLGGQDNHKINLFL